MGTSTELVMGEFQDLHKYQSNTVYTMTNENLDVHRGLLADKGPFSRVAGICAGGEVGFFCLLPKVTRELILIDHGYQAIGVAMVKHYLLRKLGAKEVQRLFIDKTKIHALVKELDVALKLLPDVFRPHLTQIMHAFARPAYYREQDYGYNNTWMAPSKDYKGELRHTPAIVKEWVRYDDETLAGIIGKLDKVTFIHGDFADLNRRRPFDLIYISNLLEHVGRNGAVKKEELKKLVKEGGLILQTDYRTDPVRYEEIYGKGATQPGTPEWLPKAGEVYDTGRTTWRHCLYQIPEEVKEAA